MRPDKEIRLCILNPNSDEKMSCEIEGLVEKIAGPSTVFFVCANPSGPTRLTGPESEAMAARGMLETVHQHQDRCDAFVIACTRDPNLNALRQSVTKPVLGAAESAFRMATILGTSFSLIQTSTRSVAAKRLLIRKYGFSSFCASVRGFDVSSDMNITERLAEEAKKAVSEDGAEVIILGGVAGIGHFSEEVQRLLNVPVVDGLKAAILLAENMVTLGLATGKTGLYSS